MRILFLTHRLPYAPNRGDRLRAYYILHALATRYEVDLFSFVHDAEEASHANELDSVASRVLTVHVPRTRNLIRGVMTLPTSTPLTHVLLDAPDARPRLAAYVAERPPDLVFVYCSGIAPLALEPFLDGVPLIVDMVDVDSEKWRGLAKVSSVGGWLSPRRWVYAREARVLARFETALAGRAEVTFVVNDRERKALLALAPEGDVRVLENGVDAAKFQPSLPAPVKNESIVFCGVMDYPPNVEGVLWLVDRVWPHVRAARPSATLLIVGADPVEHVRRLNSPLTGVFVTGTVPDVRPYLWRSKVAVAPLFSGRGVQNKIIEAVAAGLPCVVSSVVHAGLPVEILRACRVADSPEPFAQELVKLLQTEVVAPLTSKELSALNWETRLTALFEPVQSAASRRRTRLEPVA